MSVAVAYPESRQGQRNASVKNTEVSREYIGKARKVIRFCPELMQIRYDQKLNKENTDIKTYGPNHHTCSGNCFRRTNWALPTFRA
jgi:hypothetical protein